MGKNRRKEEEIANKFTEWFQSEFSYEQKLDDIETRYADPVDSAGFIEKDVVLIEFKDILSAGSIYYEGSKGSSIEKKLRTVLYNLYNNVNDRVTLALSGWDRSRTPLFILAANSISKEAQKKLKNMLDDRSVDWKFDYIVYLWGDDYPSIIFEKRNVTTDMAGINDIEFPDMPSTAPKRSEKISIDDLMAIANKNSISEILDNFLDKLNSYKPVIKLNIKNVNFAFPSRNNGSRDSVLGLWPEYFSMDNGILVSYSPKGLAKCFNLNEDYEKQFVGKKGPDVDFLGARLFLKTIEDIKFFWKVLESK